ncbi:hypothetical protein [Amycolatopsis alba]|uniref:Uncharacterized protein n=1 Tax=Amycolatopsis alba DSM 44262 TaxID=1125972 RepID=A0A229S4Z0_AMYAL|nr:hypothetical protein [Amycolatopsis alba]OXM53885.1 hypothetical protein CFP75_05845 [Amycolatopsis alba DSM 44262]
MTDGHTRVRYFATASLDPYEVEKRIKNAKAQVEGIDGVDEPSPVYTDQLLVEILAQQVAARRYLLTLAVIAVLGVAASVICAIVIAVQVTEANAHSSSSSSSSYCGLYRC